MGDLSSNFSRAEFACKGAGRPGHPDHPVVVDPVLVGALQRLRDRLGRPLRIVSGHRCEWHNRAVGGASRSQHVQGRAADIPDRLVTQKLAREIGFHGIGISPTGYVVHVDVRPGPRATWRY